MVYGRVGGPTAPVGSFLPHGERGCEELARSVVSPAVYMFTLCPTATRPVNLCSVPVFRGWRDLPYV